MIRRQWSKIVTIRKKEYSGGDLESLKNIGPATAGRLLAIGIKSAAELKRSKPEVVFQKLKKQEEGKLDICVLYQLRGAVRNIVWWKCKQ